MTDPDAMDGGDLPGEGDRLDRIERVVSDTRADNQTLRESITGLTSALSTVAEVQRDQKILKAQQAESDKKAVEAKRLATARARRARRAAWLAGIGFSIALLLVNGLTLISATRHVNELQRQTNQSRYPACLSRNEQAKTDARRELALAAAEKDPDVRAIHEKSARDTTSHLIDCEELYGMHGGH
jgi:hypothetical protein